MNNVKRNKSFNQVCVWPGTILPDHQINDFIEYFSSQGYRIQYLETIMTTPDHDNSGHVLKGTGGRSDILFAVHNEDVMKFAIPRLQMGIRWIEDVLDNEEENFSLYPDRVKEYRTW